MTAKEYLLRVYNLDHKIYLMQLEVEEYRRLASSIPGQSFDREVVSHTRNLSAPFEKWIYKAIDKENEIKEKMQELVKVKHEVLETIDKIENDNYRLLLKLRYVDSMSLPDVASKLFVSMSTIKRWHNEALQKVVLPN